jgi:pyruvate dehydrogenase E1 component beta subunit
VIAPLTYAEAILEAHRYLLSTYVEVFAIGQGLWSPWYVGSTMRDLELEFGKARIIDTPVSEQACTGAAIGAALAGYRPIVTHPRVDFALLATDQIVNQAAKWSSMFGGRAHVPVTIRCIVNRGGEQGAQHSQSLHSWFAHIPGLRVVTPATPSDARDLLVASVLNDDPVVFMDDRWLYEEVEERRQLRELDLRQEGPAVRRLGDDVTLAAVGFSTRLCMDAATQLAADGVACEVIDIRVPAPLQPAAIVASVEKTGRLVVVDGDWKTCGFGGEVIASVAESISPELWRATPSRITLPDAPAPTSRSLEEIYYPSSGQVVDTVRKLLGY